MKWTSGPDIDYVKEGGHVGATVTEEVLCRWDRHERLMTIPTPEGLTRDERIAWATAILQMTEMP